MVGGWERVGGRVLLWVWVSREGARRGCISWSRCRGCGVRRRGRVLCVWVYVCVCVCVFYLILYIYGIKKIKIM